jgi:hypothetical protein
MPYKDNENAHLTTLPPEIIHKIIANLDAVGLVCLGPTCPRLYAIHFSIHGPVPLETLGSEFYPKKCLLHQVIQDWKGFDNYQHGCWEEDGSKWGRFSPHYFRYSDEDLREFAARKRRVLKWVELWNVPLCDVAAPPIP